MSAVWVIDTNVLVSAALSVGGTCDRILRAAAAGELRLAWSAAILAEYREVLLRPKFGFSAQVVASVLAVFSPDNQGTPESERPLPDPDDEAFLAAALMTPDQVLVTGNAVHFPVDVCAPVEILSPAEALKRITLME